MGKVKYNKEPKLFSEQVELLKSRNLNFRNERIAEKILENISYNRLSRYWFPFIEEPKAKEIFREGIFFEDIFKIYQFDSNLRNLIFHHIEQIEISVRTQIIYHMSHESNDGFWYENKTYFNSYTIYLNSLKKINDTVKESKEDFILKYKDKYEQDLPPSWKSFEIISFNTLHNIFKNIKDKQLQYKVANYYGLPTEVFLSWIDSIVYIRNICAHHSRVWNTVLTVKPKWLKSKNVKPWVDKWQVDTSKSDRLKIYCSLCIIQFLMRKINPYNSFRENLVNLINENKSVINISFLDIPNNWLEQPLWEK